MNRPRITLAGIERLTERLSERDLDIVISLRRVRVATTRQLERLHFVDGTPLSNARRARRALERLTDHRVLSRLERRIGGVRAGSAPFVYTLGVAGQRLAGSRGPAGGNRVRRPWTPSTVFLAHALGVTELYVRLVEELRGDGREIVRFDTEPNCWRRYPGAGGERVRLKPDAYVATTTEEYEDRWFVELDRGTESPAKLKHHADSYVRYWQSGTEQARSGLFPRVLFVVPDEARAERMTDVLTRHPAEAWQLFQIVRFDNAARVLAGGEP